MSTATRNIPEVGTKVRVFDADGSVVGTIETLENNPHSVSAKIRSLSGRAFWANVWSDGETCEQSRWELV